MKLRIILAAAALMALTACTTEGTVKRQKTAKVEMICTLKVAAEVPNSYDFFVKYYDADGNIQSEQIVWKDSPKNIVYIESEPAKEWTKTVSTTKLPATLGLFFEVKSKDGVDLNAADEWVWGNNVLFRASNSTGGVFLTIPRIAESVFKVGKDQQEENPKAVESVLFNSIFAFQSDGTYTESMWQ